LPDPGPLVIVGAGGFGRECLDIVEALNELGAGIEFVGFVDDAPGPFELLERRNVRCLGPIRSTGEHANRFVIAIGSGEARRRIDDELSPQGLTTTVLVHPHATVGSQCTLGLGSIVNAGARLTTNISLGRHTQIHANASIGHDATIRSYASVFPGATVSGSVELGEEATVGTGANVLPGIRVGCSSYVGAGAVVTRDVGDYTVAVGVPASPMTGDPA
jgi:sugar O-acyltransferase (sialic acid O-acetyltransferase NeuD family)